MAWLGMLIPPGTDDAGVIRIDARQQGGCQEAPRGRDPGQEPPGGVPLSSLARSATPLGFPRASRARIARSTDSPNGRAGKIQGGTHDCDAPGHASVDGNGSR